MFHTPAHKQLDPAKAPGQIVNPLQPLRLFWAEISDNDGSDSVNGGAALVYAETVEHARQLIEAGGRYAVDTIDNQPQIFEVATPERAGVVCLRNISE